MLKKKKRYICDNCKRELNVEEDTIMVVCTCGYATEIKNSKEK